jgi:hypothetical protein
LRLRLSWWTSATERACRTGCWPGAGNEAVDPGNRADDQAGETETARADRDALGALWRGQRADEPGPPGLRAIRGLDQKLTVQRPSPWQDKEDRSRTGPLQPLGVIGNVRRVLETVVGRVAWTPRHHILLPLVQHLSELVCGSRHGISLVLLSSQGRVFNPDYGPVKVAR